MIDLGLERERLGAVRLELLVAAAARVGRHGRRHAAGRRLARLSLVVPLANGVFVVGVFVLVEVARVKRLVCAVGVLLLLLLFA